MSKIQKISNEGGRLLKTCWDLLKKIIKYGFDGLEWILDHWKVVFIIILASSMIIFGPAAVGEWILSLIVKTLLWAKDIIFGAVSEIGAGIAEVGAHTGPITGYGTIGGIPFAGLR